LAAITRQGKHIYWLPSAAKKSHSLAAHTHQGYMVPWLPLPAKNCGFLGYQQPMKQMAP